MFGIAALFSKICGVGHSYSSPDFLLKIENTRN
jgi:hypothetical protein